MVSSVSFDEKEIITNILNLHVPSKRIDLDPTYSKGVFYRGLSEPTLKFDIAPQVEGVQQANAENLPLGRECVDSIMFDPPFLATKGPSLEKDDESNKMAKRFSAYPDEKSLHTFYVNALKEFHRVLRPNGVVIFKCQDKVSSGKQYLSHWFIIKVAQELGFYCKDLFVYVAKNRMVADWQKKQQHARKFHSYFLVFQKCSKYVGYV